MSYNKLLITDLKDSEYSSFYRSYIEKCKGRTLSECFLYAENQLIEVFNTIQDKDLTFAYAASKWTLGEVLLHLSDAERVFQYRALRFARNDKTSLPGFDENNYVITSNAKQRTKESLLEESRLVRQSTLSLFRYFTDTELERIGTASNALMSVRAVGFVICGHQLHHIDIVKERYLNLL